MQKRRFLNLGNIYADAALLSGLCILFLCFGLFFAGQRARAYNRRFSLMSAKGGTQFLGDIVGSEVSPWHFMENVAIELAEIYGYQEVRTPIFERTDLFSQGMGGSANIVEHDLWNITDKQGRRLSLRADLLLPAMRAFGERQIGTQSTDPQKFYYLGPVFSSVKGRDQFGRQSHRFGVGSVGSSLPSLDVEAMMLAYDFFAKLGLNGLRVHLNSLGCKKCRAEYHQTLYDYFSRRADELCPTCRRRHRSHPIWTMGCEEKQCRELAQVAPSIFGCLCQECREHFEGVKAYLKELKVPYVLSPLLVPDVEYYNRTFFNICYGDHILSVGGRCDELSGLLGFSSVPAVGCDVYLDSVLNAIKEANLVPDVSKDIEVCLAGSSQAAVALLLPVLYTLRRAGIYAELAYPETADGTALYTASRTDAGFVIYLDDSCLHQRIVRFKDYASSFRDMRLGEAINRIGRYFGIEGLEDKLRPVEVRRFSISRRQSSGYRQGYEIYEPSRKNKHEASYDETSENKYSGRRSAQEFEVSYDDGKCYLGEDDIEDNETKKQIDYEMSPISGSKGSGRHSVRSRRSRASRASQNLYEESAERAEEAKESADEVQTEENSTSELKNQDVKAEIREEVSEGSGRRRRRRHGSKSSSEEINETAESQRAAKKEDNFSSADENITFKAPIETLMASEKSETDAIKEISESSNSMTEEQIAESLALPKVEAGEFTEIADPEVASLYRRRYSRGVRSQYSEEMDSDEVRRSYDRGFVNEEGYGRRSDKKSGRGRSKHSESSERSRNQNKQSEAAYEENSRNSRRRSEAQFFNRRSMQMDDSDLGNYGYKEDDRSFNYYDDSYYGTSHRYEDYVNVYDDLESSSKYADYADYDSVSYIDQGSYAEISGESSNLSELYSYADSGAEAEGYSEKRIKSSGSGRKNNRGGKYGKRTEGSETHKRRGSVRGGRTSASRKSVSAN